jgi:hypothetical protein
VVSKLLVHLKLASVVKALVAGKFIGGTGTRRLGLLGTTQRTRMR